MDFLPTTEPVSENTSSRQRASLDSVPTKSPFASSRTNIMYLEPLLNSYYQTYQNVITFSQCPVGPIKDMVTIVNPPKLSPFQTASPFFNPGYGRASAVGYAGCVYVLMRYPCGPGGGYSAVPKNTDAYMGADDIPSVLSYLMENGYRVDTSMTKMLQNSEINVGGPADTRLSGRRKMICAFTLL